MKLSRKYGLRPGDFVIVFVVLLLALAVFLPFVISIVGFSEIISFLYPICSILGVFVILFSIFSLNKADDVIHAKGKDTQNHGRCHH